MQNESQGENFGAHFDSEDHHEDGFQVLLQNTQDFNIMVPIKTKLDYSFFFYWNLGDSRVTHWLFGSWFSSLEVQKWPHGGVFRSVDTSSIGQPWTIPWRKIGWFTQFSVRKCSAFAWSFLHWCYNTVVIGVYIMILYEFYYYSTYFRKTAYKSHGTIRLTLTKVEG